jgi:UDP-GlcNAc:undecaprenyl-phosphate GlcNAc-1-phosphate transferase
MSTIGLIGGLSGIIAFAALVVLRPLAVRMNLMDRPVQRKLHKGVVPLTGGLSVFLGLLGAWLITMPFAAGYGMGLLTSVLLVALGALDDARNLSPQLRLWVQVVVGALLVYGSGVYLTTLGDLFGLGEIRLGWVGPLVTIAAVVGATNAFNMIDGIDGLIGTLSLVALVGLLLIFSVQPGFPAEGALAAGIAMALLPYLMANLKMKPFRRRIFMGDAGAMFIGIAVVWLFTKGTYGTEPAFRPVTALWLVAVPLMDMVAIMIRRVRRGQNVMVADREHLHHIFLRAGFSDRQALWLITTLAVAMAAFGLVGELFSVPQWLMFTLFLALFGGYLFVLARIWRVLVWVRQTLSLEDKATRKL